MQAGKIVRIPTRVQDFTGTLAQNAALFASIPVAGMVAGDWLIRAIDVISFDQNDWEFQFFSNIKFQQSTAAFLDGFRGYWRFTTPGDGVRIGGAGNYYYHIDGLGVYYENTDPLDTVGLLNVALVNRSAGAKTTSDVTHPFVAAFYLEPLLGW